MVIPYSARSCAICHEQESVRQILFKPTDEEAKFAKRFAEQKLDGEQWKNQMWFCLQHFETASKYQHLTCEEALQKIRKELHL